MKRIIKTLEELRATPGVNEEGYSGYLKMNGEGTSFNITKMAYCCGKELTDDMLGDWTFSPWMWKEVEGSLAAGLVFPCEMMVWDEDEWCATKTEVHAYIPTLDYPWVNKNSTCFKHAKPIPEFKPRYVWVNFFGIWEIVFQSEERVYHRTANVDPYKASDFKEIGPEITPPDLQTS